MVEKRKRLKVSKGRNSGTVSEHVHQVSFVNWFRREHPGVLIFAIPNGGARNCVTGKKLKDEGVVPGIPDLYIPAAQIWVEMKTEKGKASPKQKDWLNYLYSCGYSVHVCQGFEQAKGVIENHIRK